ncbi:MAG: DUF1810 domain-containing protein [Deltaproteobacteria bacterium]|nr:DUF1810 domain-containing protein [Deltaproteobacteria bacterium]
MTLQRFIDAQEDTYAQVVTELREGEKRSHWMWFIFPQIQGLGHSPTARFYAIADLKEALAYLEHPVLGQRLNECARMIMAIQSKTATEILGFPDDLKLCSSMTLFSAVSDIPVFQDVIDKYFDGIPDERTLKLIGVKPAQ